MKKSDQEKEKNKGTGVKRSMIDSVLKDRFLCFKTFLCVC